MVKINESAELCLNSLSKVMMFFFAFVYPDSQTKNEIHTMVFFRSVRQIN